MSGLVLGQGLGDWGGWEVGSGSVLDLRPVNNRTSRGREFLESAVNFGSVG